MAYAAISDMVQRYGEREIIANSTPAAMDLDTIDAARVNQVLGDASALIDSYLNRRYAVPLASVPATVVNACCQIARVDLANTGESGASEQMITARREAMGWLDRLARGALSLDGVIEPNTTTNFSRIQRRVAPFGTGGLC